MARPCDTADGRDKLSCGEEVIGIPQPTRSSSDCSCQMKDVA